MGFSPIPSPIYGPKKQFDPNPTIKNKAFILHFGRLGRKEDGRLLRSKDYNSLDIWRLKSIKMEEGTYDHLLEVALATLH